jgi:hypothetical protein
MDINRDLWEGYQAAFAFFNRELFQGSLPPCILTFNAKGNSTGYFKPNTWKTSRENYHEICLNPSLLNRSDDLVFQTLVRCMVFLWQAHTSVIPLQLGYCSEEFTEKMNELGLPCEKPYGMNVKWSVQENGKYASIRPKAMLSFFPLQSLEILPPKSKRVKFTCEKCGAKAMAMAGVRLVCMTEECNTAMTKEITA